VVAFDFDNDGDLDIYLANQDQPPNLYENRMDQTKPHWLMVSLETVPSQKINRNGISTRVTVVTSSGTQIRERDGGNGYSGQSDPRLHFGLGDADTVQLLEVRWPDGGLQYLENVKADQFVTVKQNPSVYASQLAIEVDPPKPWRPKKEDLPKTASISNDKLDRMLSEMEDQLRTHPDDYTLASHYRKQCATYDQHDRSIQYFTRLVEKNSDQTRYRVELACAYIDKIPTCGGVAAIVSKGTLARKSLDQLDIVIAAHPDMWQAIYCRGMNHLHWPRALLHSDDAATDLKKCIELQKKHPSGDLPEYFVRAYLALGDAQTKMKQYNDARKAWREGLKLFPNNQDLNNRLAISDNDQLLAFVEDKRSLQQPIDTGLSFLERN